MQGRKVYCLIYRKLLVTLRYISVKIMMLSTRNACRALALYLNM